MPKITIDDHLNCSFYEFIETKSKLDVEYFIINGKSIH